MAPWSIEELSGKRLWGQKASYRQNIFHHLTTSLPETAVAGRLQISESRSP